MQEQQQRKRIKKQEEDGEFGVIRGIDFKGVRTVINVDAPDTVQVSSRKMKYAQQDTDVLHAKFFQSVLEGPVSAGCSWQL